MYKSHTIFMLVFFLFSSCAVAGEDNEVPKFLNSVVEAFNDQDCLRYASHFIQSDRQKKRRESGLYFASNDATMTLKETHVLAENETEIEVAVAYSVNSSNGNSYHTSRVFLEKEEGEWRISKEVRVKVKDDFSFADNNQSTATYSSNPFSGRSLPQQPAPSQNCSGGRCGAPQAPFSTLKACRDYGFEPIPCRKGNCSVN